MRTILLVLMLCGNFGKGTFPPQAVDRIEINTRHMTEDHSFRQAIFWHWHHEFGEYHARGYNLIESEKFEPVLVDGMWYVKYLGDNHKIYQACSKTLFFSETTYDPEMEDRKRLPVKMRKLMAHGPMIFDWSSQ